MNVPAATLAKRAVRLPVLRRVQKEVRPSSLPVFAKEALSTLDNSRAVAKNAPVSIQALQTRHFSSLPPMRSNPQYTVFGENCLLSMKTILPRFRVMPGKYPTLALDAGSRGRLILEWLPRDAEGE